MKVPQFSGGGLFLFWPRQLSYRGGRPQPPPEALLASVVEVVWKFWEDAKIRVMWDSIRNSDSISWSPTRYFPAPAWHHSKIKNGFSFFIRFGLQFCFMSILFVQLIWFKLYFNFHTFDFVLYIKKVKILIKYFRGTILVKCVSSIWSTKLNFEV